MSILNDLDHELTLTYGALDGIMSTVYIPSCLQVHEAEQYLRISLSRRSNEHLLSLNWLCKLKVIAMEAYRRDVKI